MFSRKLKSYAAAIVASVMLIGNVQSVSADVINTDTMSNGISVLTMTDDELKHALVANNKTSEMLEAGEFVTRVSWFNENVSTYEVAGPFGYYDCMMGLGEDNYIVTPLADFGYFNYAESKKLVRLHDEILYKFICMERDIEKDKIKYDPNEVILDKVINNNYLLVVSQYPYSFKNMDQATLDLRGYSRSDKVEYAVEYSVYDVNTLRLLTSTKHVCIDGQMRLFSAEKYEYSRIQPDLERVMKLYNEVCGGKTHTITVIVGKGTSHEESYVITANEESELDLWVLDSNNTYNIYADEGYKNQITDTYIKFDSDKILFMK